MKKIITSILLIALLTLSVFSVFASADFGSGVATVAEQTKVIKTGLIGRKLTFSENDFKQALCVDTFDSITITKLPKSSEGTLMLAGRRLGENSVVKRKNIPSLVFIPASKEVTECKFYFTIDKLAGGEEIEFIIKLADKINYEPKIEEEAQDSFAKTTQREIGVYGKLTASDPEGDKIEYIIVSYPESGTLNLMNKNTGEYIYTPKNSYTGKDSFIFVARDEWGNYSTPKKVTVSVTERMSEVVYHDMKDRSEYNSAVKITAMGVMSGELLGDHNYFNPDKTVTRAEFLAMAMKALGIRPTESNSSTYFDDNDEIPTALLPYVVTAQKMGAVLGVFKDSALLFRPNESITKYEAAVMLTCLTGASAEGETPVFADNADIPVWARASVYAMYSMGIFDTDGGNVNPKDTVSRAECAEYLVRIIEK